MMLADIEGNLIFVVVVAVIGLLNWLSQKGAKSAPPPPRDPRSSQQGGGGLRPQQAPRSGAGSEEERVRRFMEALGVPVDQTPPPPVKPRPAAPATPLPNIRPYGPVVSGGPLQGPKRPAPVKSPPSLPARPRPQEPVRQAPSLPVEKLHIPELKVPVVSEFNTVSSHISATPLDFSAAAEQEAYRTTPVSEPEGQSLLRLLRTPRDLRSAMILREVLGPPRGLPNADQFPTF